jgi:hypothetical protein
MRLVSESFKAVLLTNIVLSTALQAEEMAIPAEKPRTQADYLPSARPQVKEGVNLFIEGEWLYWQPSETGLGYAINQNGFIPEQPETMGVGNVANPSFEWKSGFRLGIGYNIPRDQWAVNLLWTAYNGKGSDSQSSNSLDTPTIYPSFIHPNTYNNEDVFACFSANSSLSIDLNQLDLNLGRQFKVAKKLSFKPYIGLRSAWIDQTYNINYLNLWSYDDILKEESFVLDEYLTHIVNKFWGMGIKGGFASDWELKWGLSLFSDFTASLLYGLFDTSYTEEFTQNELNISGTTLSETNNFHAGRAVLDFQLGLRWSRFLRNDRFKLILQAGWEHHSFFSQGQILRFVDGRSWGNFIQTQSDLYFQGWTASSSFYF